MSSARKLGELEAKRAELVAKRLAGPPATRFSTSVQARNQWARVVKAVAQAVALDGANAARLDEAFVTPLRLAEAKANRKARAVRAPGADGGPAGGEADEGAAV